MQTVIRCVHDWHPKHESLPMLPSCRLQVGNGALAGWDAI